VALGRLYVAIQSSLPPQACTVFGNQVSNTDIRLKCTWFLECLEHACRNSFTESSITKGRFKAMIEIFNAKDEKLGEFKNYRQLFWSINMIERLKLLKGKYPYGQSSWCFLHRPYEKLSMVYHHMIGKSPTPIEKQAHEKQLGIIDIYQGSYDSFTQILVTSDLDIDGLRKNWCRAYCKAKGYIIGRR
jgi:hypothetical protein